MTNLYEKENPFISTVVEPNVGASKKDPKINDAEATGKIAADVASFEVEKGNPDTTLKSVVYESDRKLGLEDLNVVVDSTENMNVNDSKPDDENMGDDSIQPSPEEIDEPKDVGPDVGTSLDQHDQQGNDDGIIKKDESGQETGSDHGVSSGHTTEKSSPTEEEQTEVESDPEEDVYHEKDEEDVVNVDNIDSNNIPLRKRDAESVAKRLRSNKGKVVPSETGTPNTKTKTVGVGPKRG